MSFARMVIYALSLACLPTPALAGEKLVAASAEAVAAHLQRLGGAPEATLIAWDIDNTLLKTNQDLGSEPWFDWQAAQLEAAARSRTPCESCSAPDFARLLNLNTLALSITGTQLVDATSPEIIARLGNQGYPQLIVTSRAPEVAPATLRELARHGLDFSGTQKARFAAVGAELAPPSPGRAIRFEQGVLFTSGQNKGAILRELLRASGARDIQRVVLVDNLQKHGDRLHEAFAAPGAGVTTVSIRHTGQDGEIDAFNRSAERKRRARRDALKLRKAIAESFGQAALAF